MSATFEQWLEFVFNHPVLKREWYWDEDFDSRWEALELTDVLIVQYMTRLFLERGVLASYSLDKVEQGLWFLLGESSPGCSSKALLRREAALFDRVACIHAMSSFFRNFILAVTPGQFDPKAPTVAVDGAAYMWWDIFPMQSYMRSHTPGPTRAAALLSIVEEWKLAAELHNTVLKAMAAELEFEIEPEIHRATLRVMGEVLDLPSELCQFSALHGLGHWHAHHPEQVEQIVDAFLARHKDLRPHLIEYASRARIGQCALGRRDSFTSSRGRPIRAFVGLSGSVGVIPVDILPLRSLTRQAASQFYFVCSNPQPTRNTWPSEWRRCISRTFHNPSQGH